MTRGAPSDPLPLALVVGHGRRGCEVTLIGGCAAAVTAVRSLCEHDHLMG